jgi:ribonuclease HI
MASDRGDNPRSDRRVAYHRPPMTTVDARPGEALVWTDGACSGNPGPGGWAAIVIPPDGGEPIELSGGHPDTTNNRMELSAALHGLGSLPAGSAACVVTDSLLLLKSMTIWLPGWKRKGWKTASGQPVKNQDLLVALEAEVARHAAVRWQWVKGHAATALNERADRLAVAAAQAAA